MKRLLGSLLFSTAGLDVGLLLLRVSAGGLMLVHGILKLLGFAEKSGGFPDPLGVGSTLSLAMAVGAEVGCALLLILGLATRAAAIPLMITMLVAAFMVHANNGWGKQELGVVYLAMYTAILFTGAGRLSLDHLWLRHRFGALSFQHGFLSI